MNNGTGGIAYCSGNGAAYSWANHLASYYTIRLRGVFGSGDTVVFVGEGIWNGTDHDMIVMFYNRVLGRWFAPQAPFGTTISDPNAASYRFNDVGGFGVGSVGIVGSVYSSTASEQRGLYLLR